MHLNWNIRHDTETRESRRIRHDPRHRNAWVKAHLVARVSRHTCLTCSSLRNVYPRTCKLFPLQATLARHKSHTNNYCSMKPKAKQWLSCLIKERQHLISDAGMPPPSLYSR